MWRKVVRALLAGAPKILRAVCAGVCVLALAGFFVLVVLSLWDWVSYFRSRTWVRVPADVTEISRWGSEKAGSNAYACEYRYRYEGTGHTSRNVRVQRFASVNRRDRYDALRRAYREGRSVEAWVNPDRPEESALVREPTANTLIFTPLGLLLTAVGVFVGWAKWGRRRGKTRRPGRAS